MTPTTDGKHLTDYEVVAAAERLVKGTHSDNLPANPTLEDVCRSLQAVHQLGIKFLEKYGDRLAKLDGPLHRDLECWSKMLF